MAGTKLQRQISPIPPGRYWITVNSPGNIADFDAWVRDMAGAVRVESSQMLAGPAQFVIFQVPQGRSPFLNGSQFGYPNFAGPEVHSVQDVEQSPIVPGALEQIEQFGSNAIGDLKFAALALLVLLALSASR